MIWIYAAVAVVIVVLIIWLAVKGKKKGPSEPNSFPPSAPGA